jgi:hypothetical protein
LKQITAVALLSIASFVTAGKALAQDRAVQATVPFDFTVGDKLLPRALTRLPRYHPT